MHISICFLFIFIGTFIQCKYSRFYFQFKSMQCRIHNDCKLMLVASCVQIVKVLALFGYCCLFETIKPLRCLQNEAVSVYCLSICIVSYSLCCTISFCCAIPSAVLFLSAVLSLCCTISFCCAIPSAILFLSAVLSLCCTISFCCAIPSAVLYLAVLRICRS